jgi:hypothetical protein
MNRDGRAIAAGIADAVDVAGAGAERLDFARAQELRRAIGREAAIALAHEALGRSAPRSTPTRPQTR